MAEYEDDPDYREDVDPEEIGEGDHIFDYIREGDRGPALDDDFVDSILGP